MPEITKDVFVAVVLDFDGLDDLLKKLGEHYIFEKDSPNFIKKVVEGVVKYQLKGASNYHGIRALTINKCQKLLRETNTHFLGKLSGSSSKKQTYKTDAATLHNAWSHKLRMTKQKEGRSLSKRKTLSNAVTDVRVNSALNGAGSAGADPEVEPLQDPFSDSEYPTESEETENENEDEEGEEEETCTVEEDNSIVNVESENEFDFPKLFEEKDAKGDQQEDDDSHSYSYSYSNSNSYSYSSSESEGAMPDEPAIFGTATRIAPMDVSCQLARADGLICDDDDDDDDAPPIKQRPAAALKKRPAGNPAAKPKPAPKASKATPAAKSKALPKPPAPPCKAESGAEPKAGMPAAKSKALPKPPAPPRNAESGAEPKAGTPASNALPKPPAVQVDPAPPKAGQPAGKTPTLAAYHAHMRRLLSDTTGFHPELPSQKRMKMAAADWQGLPWPAGSIIYGCGKCRSAKTGCLKCNPAKMKPELFEALAKKGF